MLPAALPPHRDGQKGAQWKRSTVQGIVKLAPLVSEPASQPIFSIYTAT